MEWIHLSHRDETEGGNISTIFNTVVRAYVVYTSRKAGREINVTNWCFCPKNVNTPTETST
jgi:hypothetical protein